MAAFPTSAFSTSVIINSSNILPSHINGLPVSRKWPTGNKPKYALNIIIYESFRVAVFSDRSVVLCDIVYCTNMSCIGKRLCTIHISGKESYTKCRNLQCITTPGFGYYSRKPLFCLKHKAADMIDVKHKRCEYVGCPMQSSYGMENQPHRFCEKHKQAGMINRVMKLCEFPGCPTCATCGMPGQSRVLCSKHKSPGMIIISACRCHDPSCMSMANFGLQGGRPVSCSVHKASNMVDVTHKKCEDPNCVTQATFGNVGESPKFCAKHKPPNMIDVRRKRCEQVGCQTISSFGIEGGPKQFCSKHKRTGMICIGAPKCNHENCGTRPTYGNRGEKAEYCFIHKPPNMVDVKNKMCIHPGCETRACHGSPGEKSSRCSSHKRPGMVNSVTKKCEHPGCHTICIYGHEGGIVQFCETHKRHGMINLKYRKCCHKDCEIQPSYSKLYAGSPAHCVKHSTTNEYSYEKKIPVCTKIGCSNVAFHMDPADTNFYPIRCSEHKMDTDIELVLKACVNCDEELYIPHNRPMCMDCGNYRKRVLHKFKESMIKAFLDSNNIPYIHDRPILRTGVGYRPDFLIQTDHRQIILEVDEHQHDTYDPNDEALRMRVIYEQIQQIKPGSEVVFIRYNPDAYMGHQVDTKSRQSHLYTILRYIMEQPPFLVPLGKVYMFYDGFDGNPDIQPIQI